MGEKGSPKRDISNPLYHQEWDMKMDTSTQVPDGQEHECSQRIVARASTLCGWKKLCIPEPAWYNLMPKTISVSRWHWSLTNQYFGQKVGLIPSVAPTIFGFFLQATCAQCVTGGPHSWESLSSACEACGLVKAGRLIPNSNRNGRKKAAVCCSMDVWWMGKAVWDTLTA